MTATGTINGTELTAAVDPIVVDGSLALVRLAVAASGMSASPGGSTDLGMLTRLWRDPYLYSGTALGAGIRVLDLPARSVFLAAANANGGALSTLTPNTGSSRTALLAIGVPTSDTVDLLLPGFGLVQDVPVVRDAPTGAVASAFTAVHEEMDPASATVRTYPLSSYVTSPSEEFRTTTTGDDVNVDLSADVLFAYNKADLTARADAALRTVGQQIVASGTGTLTITGHTDDQGTRSYNQKLSERRAAAVGDRLKTLVDLSRVAVTVTGVGESDPAVAGTSAAARALNRRVELAYTASTPGASTSTTSALPSASGTAGTASQGVTVEDRWVTPHTRWDVKLTRVIRKDGYLVGELAVTLESGPETNIAILGSGNFDSRGSWDPSLAWSVSRLSLLTADTRTYPVQYAPKAAAKGNATIRRPLGDTLLFAATAGQPRTVTVVWPDIGGSEVTLDAAPPRWLLGLAEKGLSTDAFLENQPSFRLSGAQVAGCLRRAIV